MLHAQQYPSPWYTHCNVNTLITCCFAYKLSE